MKNSASGFDVRPLSFTKYFLNNTRKSVAMMLALILSVFMIITFQMIIFSVNECARLGDVEVSKYATKAFPVKDGKIETNIIKEIRNNPDVKKVIPMYVQDMDYNHFFGTCNMNIFFVRQKKMKPIMSKLHIKLIKGRLPVEGKKEIILDWRIINNKDKKLGGYIGKKIDKSEKLPGKYKIVGIMDGKCITGFVPSKFGQQPHLNSLLIFPKGSQLENMNSELTKIQESNLSLWTKKKADSNYKKNSNRLNTMFAIMTLAIILVIAFVSGNSSYAHYFSRRYEFGILQAIGYTRPQILFRASKEVFLLNSIGLLGGIILSLVTGFILNKAFFIPNGYPFSLIQANGFLMATTVLLCTTLFALIPAAWMLSKIDPVTVVEISE